MSKFKIIFGVLILMIFGVIEANAVDQSICVEGSTVVLYPNGSLKSCVPNESFGLNDISCNSQNPASFYDNGQLESCILAKPATISGQECKEFGPISFYPDGKLKSCVRKE